MRELRTLTQHLQRLQAYVPALVAKGVVLGPNEINLDTSRKGRPSIYVTAPLQDHRNHALYRALLELGFTKREQFDRGAYTLLLLTLGPVRLSFAAGLPLPEVQASASVEMATA
ncbi:hypothetical protein [Azohydromonas lata]|uniref:Uncharacterized protein n=1 Tax=Azohydromonas lata TaxID=45677 RepID=A0ABU5ID06_9BURK|nr:hypothetical protein [Azohydromonas lata]MDZ5456979.1 hypothetical protein [Azohydromonas lata]